jgi:hypothetical protein
MNLNLVVGANITTPPPPTPVPTNSTIVYQKHVSPKDKRVFLELYICTSMLINKILHTQNIAII